MKQDFGRLPDGRQASLYWIEDEYTQAAFTNLGAAIVRWLVPDAVGRKDDSALMLAITPQAAALSPASRVR